MGPCSHHDESAKPSIDERIKAARKKAQAEVDAANQAMRYVVEKHINSEDPKVTVSDEFPQFQGERSALEEYGRSRLQAIVTKEEEEKRRQAHYADLWMHAWLTIMADPEVSTVAANKMSDEFLEAYKERFPDV